MAWRPESGELVDFDVVIIGAGAAGLYALHRVRGLGLSAKVYEKGDGVGGTWYWNRYPGARCDVESWDYCYTFSEELELEWEWTERFPTQPELERYFNHVADRFDLRRDIEFETRVDQARFDDDQCRWLISTSNGETVSARFLISAAGCLSEVNTPRFEGVETFEGRQIHTARWPKGGIDVTGMRVGVIGTGSTAVQAIPQLAKQADHLFVFQRTPQFAIPARNRPIDADHLEELKHNYRERWELKRSNPVGMGRRPPEVSSALEVDETTRTRIMEDSWALGGPGFARTFDDVMTNAESNQITSQFVLDKIKEKVADPAVAESLLAIDHPLGARRLIVEIDYFETYNRENVTLVDVATAPIEEITPQGLRTTEDSYELDLIVYATGFDGMTGALLAMDIRGVGGLPLRAKWAEGAGAYLGLVASGFPNFFMITGPGSPAVFSNVIFSIEQHVDWIADCLAHMLDHGLHRIDADPEAEAQWTQQVHDIAAQSIVGKTDSWWTGANIEGKPQGVTFYLGGTHTYREICEENAANGYKGFVFREAHHTAARKPHLRWNQR
ncbi:flavin-containing monooxygenase [Candidatus Poriferisocius sp.]|uniref:flavin-containing monooxygenase n=1 Tax=Candidatus Poriferisocius sp. TaxID=3101276 RepID=UPI003B01907E